VTKTGRPPGSRDKRPRRSAARKIAEAAVAEGITPLEVMLRTMQDAWSLAETAATDRERLTFRQAACSVAEKAAPYVHPRLSATEHSGALGLSHEEALAELDSAAEDDGPGAATTH
jgi:hypothetical protein